MRRMPAYRMVIQRADERCRRARALWKTRRRIPICSRCGRRIIRAAIHPQSGKDNRRVTVMSRAFVKEADGVDAVENLPERPVSANPNFVTAEGLATIEAALEKTASRARAGAGRERSRCARAHRARPALLDLAPHHRAGDRAADRRRRGAVRLDRHHRARRRPPPDLPHRRRGRSRSRPRHAFACRAAGARAVRQVGRRRGARPASRRRRSSRSVDGQPRRPPLSVILRSAAHKPGPRRMHGPDRSCRPSQARPSASHLRVTR